MTARLAELRAAAAEQVSERRRELEEIIDSSVSTNGDDEHDPEGATVGFERAQAQSLLEETVRRLAELDAAIERAAAGTYGRCTRCGRSIGAERLAARPAAATCIVCASTIRSSR